MDACPWEDPQGPQRGGWVLAASTVWRYLCPALSTDHLLPFATRPLALGFRGWAEMEGILFHPASELGWGLEEKGGKQTWQGEGVGEGTAVVL